MGAVLYLPSVFFSLSLGFFRVMFYVLELVVIRIQNLSNTWLVVVSSALVSDWIMHRIHPIIRLESSQHIMGQIGPIRINFSNWT